MNKKVHKCYICDKVIPKERIKILEEFRLDQRRFTCVEHSEITRIQGIYLGENGTSEIKFCRKVYNDSVKQKFVEITDTEDEDDFID